MEGERRFGQLRVLDFRLKLGASVGQNRKKDCSVIAEEAEVTVLESVFCCIVQTSRCGIQYSDSNARDFDHIKANPRLIFWREGIATFRTARQFSFLT